MTTLDQAWINTQADGDIAEKNPAPVGTVGIVRIADYRTGKSQKGEMYFAVDIVDDAQGFNWGIYKQFTKNGQPHEGSIKSAKITLSQLGLDVQSPALLEPLLKSIVGRYYAYEQVLSDRVNTATGAYYVNTNINGVASPPPPAAPQAQAAPVQQQPVQTPTGPVQFDAAIPGAHPAQAMQQQVAAAAAVQTDDHPFA